MTSTSTTFVPFVLFTLSLCIVANVQVQGFFGRHKQAVAAKGCLVCHGKPSVGTKVKLYDNDHFTPDDKLAEGKTDKNGCFYLRGYTKEMTRITPKLNVYHNCGDLVHFCNQKFTIQIPKSYVTKGKHAKQVFDAGKLNLDGKYSGQSRDCLN